MQAIFKMLSLNNAPTVPIAEDDAVADLDEPPDQVSALHHFSNESHYPKAHSMPPNLRRESLLTRAIRSDSSAEASLPHHKHYIARGHSTASSHSNMSMASTAELTSDASPTHSCTPSPPLPDGFIGLAGHKPMSSQVAIAPANQEDKPAVAEPGEAAVEKTLGRKRCIMFACGQAPTSEVKEVKEPVKEEPKQEPPKRKCLISFACPARQNSPEPNMIEAPKRPRRSPSPNPVAEDIREAKISLDTSKTSAPTTPLSPQTFHEFGSSHDETDAWVNNAPHHEAKLTVTDCMSKENAIRKLGQEAEEEAEEEEREEEENMENNEDIYGQPQEDDFAPSDDGNDSDDEAGFADSDDESDAGSDYQFWAPAAQSSTTAATSTENLSHISNRGRSRSRASSLESSHSASPHRMSERPMFMKSRSRQSRLRPGTPELPDSTDFVCGTLDEDRPLEAAYISCLEQRKREKHIPIPQDIDPSFPTSDPEDELDEEDEDESPGAGGPMWMKDQFDDFDVHGQSKTPQATKSASPSSPRNEFPFPKPQLARRPTNRSPPPKLRCRSPPPAHNLFGNREKADMRPAPHARLRSPPASPRVAPTALPQIEIGVRPFGRGRRERTSSLPRTPNPFFKHFNVGSPSISNVASGAVTPATEEPRSDLHVRGPVDIVMGLERKRQKRKEKFWRQHCRKAAKEYAERKPVPGRGATRMKELGLECAERNRGYGIPGQSTQLVISL